MFLQVSHFTLLHLPAKLSYASWQLGIYNFYQYDSGIHHLIEISARL